MRDQDTELLSTRTSELMAESGLSWRDAWLQAEDELGPDLGLRPRPRFRPSTRFNILWVLAGLLFALVPGIASQIISPGWLATSSSEDASVGGWVYLGLLIVSGLSIAAMGLRFGLTGRFTEGWAAALRMYPGVVVGTWLSVIVIGSSGYDVGAAAAFAALFIGIPYWWCAALSLVLGSVVFQWRSKP
jgi:hypothetical protein